MQIGGLYAHSLILIKEVIYSWHPMPLKFFLP